MRALKQVQPAGAPSAESLPGFLDAEIHRLRARRQASSQRRTALGLAALLLLFSAALALGLLFARLHEGPGKGMPLTAERQ